MAREAVNLRRGSLRLRHIVLPRDSHMPGGGKGGLGSGELGGALLGSCVSLSLLAVLLSPMNLVELWSSWCMNNSLSSCGGQHTQKKGARPPLLRSAVFEDSSFLEGFSYRGWEGGWESLGKGGFRSHMARDSHHIWCISEVRVMSLAGIFLSRVVCHFRLFFLNPGNDIHQRFFRSVF